MGLCMRTTIELNDDLLRRAKRRAADESTTLRDVIEQALRAHLATRGPASRRRFTLRWRAERGTIQPGVRLDDRDALFDLMDRHG
jgi:post-segregation antitoxin (ccd killing protein)